MGRKLTSEQRQHFVEACRKTKLERYGDPNYNNMTKNKQTKLERYGDENYNNMSKQIETNLKKYGCEYHTQSDEVREKIHLTRSTEKSTLKQKQTVFERYGVDTVNLVPEIREKYKKTLQEHYGVDNPLKSEIIRHKKNNTMKVKGSYHKSKPEETIYSELISIYDEDDVIRQYSSDERYPFNCDFYIKSIDQFIEVNYHPSHGEHPFDKNNAKDIETLRLLEETNTRWSKLVISVWTKRDVNKRTFAIRNNLNYITLYKNEHYKK